MFKVPMQYWAKEDKDNIMFTCCVLHNILLDHESREWIVTDDTDDVGLPLGANSVAGRPDHTDFSYMSVLCRDQTTTSRLKNTNRKGYGRLFELL